VLHHYSIDIHCNFGNEFSFVVPYILCHTITIPPPPQPQLSWVKKKELLLFMKSTHTRVCGKEEYIQNGICCLTKDGRNEGGVGAPYQTIVKDRCVNYRSVCMTGLIITQKHDLDGIKNKREKRHSSPTPPTTYLVLTFTI
jgi:hypothetical protein